jgi:small-conductance mechanosensitive channel
VATSNAEVPKDGGVVAWRAGATKTPPDRCAVAGLPTWERSDMGERGRNRLITAVAMVFALALYVGIALLAAGALLAWVTDQSSVSLAIAGVGVLLIVIGVVASGYWP